jgi:hypothetical protein
MAAFGKSAWFAPMNWKASTAGPRSPARTKPSRARGYRAPASAAGFHAAAGRVPRARSLLDRDPPLAAWLRDSPHRGQPPRPSSGWSGGMAQAPGPDRSDRGRHGPDRPSAGGTRPGMRGGSWASDKHLTRERSRCPPNRGNPNPTPSAMPESYGGAPAPSIEVSFSGG